MKTVEQIVNDALIQEITQLFEHCTTKQIAFFSQLFSENWKTKLDENQLKNALQIVQRTVIKNKEDKTNGKV